jgi:predicted enzyme related to lactoylglutathione lyase
LKITSIIYQKQLFEADIPLTSFNVDNLESLYERLSNLGVTFSMKPTLMGETKLTVFNDTCGNHIQLFH